MLRIVNPGIGMPMSWPVDPSAEFESGMIAQLGLQGNNIVCGVSDGISPIGIIDDFKTRAFYAPAMDEVVIVSPPSIMGPNNRLVAATDTMQLLKNSNVLSSSFTSTVDVELIPRNGAVRFLANTELNFDLDGDGTADSIRTVVSYTYQVPNIPGADSTLSSGRVTVWFNKMIAQTDKFETNQRYQVGGNLFVSEEGLLTSRRPSVNHAGMAIITAPPTSIMGMIEFMWL